MVVHFIAEWLLILGAGSLLISMAIRARAKKSVVIFYPAFMSLQVIDLVLNLVYDYPLVALVHAFVLLGFVVLIIFKRQND